MVALITLLPARKRTRALWLCVAVLAEGGEARRLPVGGGRAAVAGVCLRHAATRTAPQAAPAAQRRGLAAGGFLPCHGPAALAQYGGALFAYMGSNVIIRDNASLTHNTAKLVREAAPGAFQSPGGCERTHARNSGREAQSLARSL